VKRPITPTDSGRAFEAFLEHEHLLGDRIFHCGRVIVENLKKVSQVSKIPKKVLEAMGVYVYLTNNFADQAHFAAEEAAIPLAIARGMDPKQGQWVLDQHQQARAYFRGFDIAYKRIYAGDDAAISDFWRTVEAFVILFELHAVRENDELYPAMGKVLTDADDSLLMNLLQQIGPRDFTPYVGLVSKMEELLGVPHPEE
jgi:hemerythrin-like domain-containing protein